jgi:hypothetical protein
LSIFNRYHRFESAGSVPRPGSVFIELGTFERKNYEGITGISNRPWQRHFLHHKGKTFAISRVSASTTLIALRFGHVQKRAAVEAHNSRENHAGSGELSLRVQRRETCDRQCAGKVFKYTLQKFVVQTFISSI